MIRRWLTYPHIFMLTQLLLLKLFLGQGNLPVISNVYNAYTYIHILHRSSSKSNSADIIAYSQKCYPILNVTDSFFIFPTLSIALAIILCIPCCDDLTGY